MSTDPRRVFRAHERLARLYADDRFLTAEQGVALRAFAAVWIWIEDVEGVAYDVEFRDRLVVAAGFGHTDEDVTWSRWRNLIAADLPRYQPPGNLSRYGRRPCEGSMVRREGTCGQPTASVAFRVTDPATGQWRMAAYCRRHEDEGREVEARQLALRRSGTLPEPHPNTGGLLPGHLRATNWPDLYLHASPYGDWKPPSLGIRADDWPVMAKVNTARPRLLIAQDGPADVAVGETEPLAPPVLTLVRTPEET